MTPAAAPKAKGEGDGAEGGDDRPAAEAKVTRRAGWPAAADAVAEGEEARRRGAVGEAEARLAAAQAAVDAARDAERRRPTTASPPPRNAWPGADEAVAVARTATLQTRPPDLSSPSRDRQQRRTCSAGAGRATWGPRP